MNLLTLSPIKVVPVIMFVLAGLNISAPGENTGEILGVSAVAREVKSDVESGIEGQATTVGSVWKSDALDEKLSFITESSFDQAEQTEVEEIPFETEYTEDDELEIGLEEVVTEGINGTRTLTYLVTSWQGEEIYRNLVATVVEEPVIEVIARGTKVVWREYEAAGVGKIDYWRKIKVWATKYDGNCAGCRGLTYSGTPVRKGVCAVDPTVIPLGTNFYVEGYGMCRSEDIGGGIKGEKLDLGYEDVQRGEWRTGWTTVYLMTNSPVGDGPD